MVVIPTLYNRERPRESKSLVITSRGRGKLGRQARQPGSSSHLSHRVVKACLRVCVPNLTELVGDMNIKKKDIVKYSTYTES